jgi:hypothetical protein
VSCADQKTPCWRPTDQQARTITATLTRHQTEVSGQLHAPVALSPDKKPHVDSRASLDALDKTQISCSLVTTLTELPHNISKQNTHV